MTYYTSAEAHSSVQLCVEQIGIGASNLRLVETDANFRMRPDALRAAIEADVAQGLSPACVVASVGGTNVGAIDPVGDIADVCETFDLWLHVDGAYGGIVGLDPAYTQMTSALNRVDSLTLDPHKWLQVPLDCGALLVRIGSETMKPIPWCRITCVHLLVKMTAHFGRKSMCSSLHSLIVP